MQKIEFESCFESLVDDDPIVSIEGDSFYDPDGEFDSEKLKVCYEIFAGKNNLTEAEKKEIEEKLTLILNLYDDKDIITAEIIINPADFKKDQLIDNFWNGIEFHSDDFQLLAEDFKEYYGSKVLLKKISKSEKINILKIKRTYLMNH